MTKKTIFLSYQVSEFCPERIVTSSNTHAGVVGCNQTHFFSFFIFSNWISIETFDVKSFQLKRRNVVMIFGNFEGCCCRRNGGGALLLLMRVFIIFVIIFAFDG